jgi:catechol 2,3-dioxygenase-like lactoylglutathione lyase family enzyme
MAIEVVELHHHGIRIGNTQKDAEKAREFYSDVLGLNTDPARPNIASIPGFWMYVGEGKNTTQIHLMGAKGKSPMARSRKEDPTLPHVALAVKDIQTARKELDKRGIWYWDIQGLVGQNSDQVFVRDPFDNIIELHQVGTCTCNKVALKPARKRTASAKRTPSKKRVTAKKRTTAKKAGASKK